MAHASNVIPIGGRRTAAPRTPPPRRTPPSGDASIGSSLLPLSSEELIVVLHLRGIEHHGPPCALCRGGRR